LFKHLKHNIKPIYFHILHVRDSIRFRRYLKKHSQIKIIIGSSRTKCEGWFSSEQYFLDIRKESNFRKILKEKKINRLLAEHVLEHLTEEELSKAIRNFYLYSTENVNIRIAVPDGNHPDTDYIKSVQPDTELMSHGHQVLFNYQSLLDAFRIQGFEAQLLEYWDENRQFHSIYQNDEKGFIYRSFLNDSRNIKGEPNYTSLIVDFFKK